MTARASFSFEDGIRISSWKATLPFRMRVSMSAIGSVIMMRSPTRLRDAGDLAGVHHLPQAHAAEAELAVDGARPTATAAPRVRPHLVLRLAHRLLDECLLRHYCCPSRLNGKPKASSRARPSALVRAVVTIVMSMPRGASTLS